MQTTVNDLAERLQCSWHIANAIVVLLNARGVANRIGYQRSTAGRPSIIWELPDTYEFNFNPTRLPASSE